MWKFVNVLAWNLQLKNGFVWNEPGFTQDSQDLYLLWIRVKDRNVNFKSSKEVTVDISQQQRGILMFEPALTYDYRELPWAIAGTILWSIVLWSTRIKPQFEKNELVKTTASHFSIFSSPHKNCLRWVMFAFIQMKVQSFKTGNRPAAAGRLFCLTVLMIWP